jgi:hypothetical protein
MTRELFLVPIVTGLLLAGCVRVPTGPNVMVLPGRAKSFDEFRADDWSCREFAGYQTGTTPNNAGAASAASGAAIGTVVGAATGAAIGAASGNPATGAAVGAGAGLLGGSILGADSAERSQYAVQHRYDVAYMQCMYAKGNQIPVPRGSQRPATYGPPRAARVSPGEIPPPPRRGMPPPPPPDADDY